MGKNVNLLVWVNGVFLVKWVKSVFLVKWGISVFLVKWVNAVFLVKWVNGAIKGCAIKTEQFKTVVKEKHKHRGCLAIKIQKCK